MFQFIPLVFAGSNQFSVFYAVDYQPNVLCGYGFMALQFIAWKYCMFIFEKFLSKLMNFTRHINVQTTRWATNKQFMGSYSFHLITTDLLKTSSENLAHPIYSPSGIPCILFAGETTHPDFFSTVNGAVENGYSEARRISSIYGMK